MKNLTTTLINLKEVFKSYGQKQLRDFTKLEWGELGNITAIISDTEREYFMIDVNEKQAINCSKSSDIKIHKVKAGIFKGDVCVIERSHDDKTYLYVAHKDGVFKYPVMTRRVTNNEVDQLLNLDAIQDILLNALLKPDNSKRKQYEILCDGLPKQVWSNQKFTSKLFDGILEVGEANNNDGENSLSDVQETAYAYVLSKIANSTEKRENIDNRNK